jgi:hypothetical protein
MKTIIDLGKIPLVNNLKLSKEEALNSNKFSLKIVEDDNLMMRLDTAVDPTELYSTYYYKSGISEPYIQHCKRMWYDIEHYIYGATPFKKPENKLLFVDIGGNDGTLLNSLRSQFDKNLGEVDLINVDASESFKEENESKAIKYVNSFWGDIQLERKANLITSTNVFQHTEDVHKFLKGIQNNLDGIWVLEFPYFQTTVETDQFDQIYHEHYYYWLVTPLVKLFEQYGLGIISISEQKIHGGTLRIISTNKRETDYSVVNSYLEKEKNFDFSKWSDKISLKLMNDKIFLNRLGSRGGSFACFGAAAKGCVYLNCLDYDFIRSKVKYVVDDTKEKQGKFVPGIGLEIVDREILYRDQPEYLIIMAHNFKDHIIKTLRPHYKGKIIVMLPEIQIYD